MGHVPSAAMETVTPIPPVAEVALGPSKGRARAVGAALGAALGLVGIALLAGVGAAGGVVTSPALALLIGPDGIFSLTAGAPFVWVVPPLAAVLAGALLGPRAARRLPLAGLTMGYVTYAIGILVGPIFVLFLPSLGTPGVGLGGVGVVDAALGLVFGLGVLWLIGAVALAPALALCALAGVVWAAGVRRLVPIPPGARPVDPGRPPLLAAALVVLAGVLGLLWVVLTIFLQILVDAQVD